MRLFRKTNIDSEIQSYDVELEPVVEIPFGAFEIPSTITVSDESGERIYFIETKEEGKAVIERLRLVKKELQLQKREVTMDMQAIRADYSSKTARRTNFRGSSGFAKTFRAIDGYSRDADRRNKADQIDPLQGQKEQIDQFIHMIDDIILDVQRFMVTAPSEAKPKATKAKPASKPSTRLCHFCTEDLKAGDKYCSSCGEAVH